MSPSMGRISLSFIGIEPVVRRDILVLDICTNAGYIARLGFLSVFDNIRRDK